MEKFAKSHIIPRSFFKKLRGTSKHSVYFEATRESLRTVFKQAGIYEPNILCENCERLFTPFDTHGFAVLSKTRGDDDVYRNRFGTVVGAFIKEADYRLLKLFALSVLWRAHASRLAFFWRVDLGDDAPRIRDILREQQLLDAETYSVVLILPFGQAFPDNILPPWVGMIDGVRFYRIYFPNIIVLVKIDSLPTRSPLNEFQLKPGNGNLFLFMHYEGSPEEQHYWDLYGFMKRHNLFRN